ncbi:MAG: hypothetical protein Q8R25_02480 [bacterium]|nr:hypothetical protein [bacterium]
MKLERVILVVFFGNYLINNVVAAIVALVPASVEGGIFTAQYISFVALSMILVGALAWWCGKSNLKMGAIFGGIGFLVAIATAFVSGISGVILQTGSLSQAMGVIPNFWPFLANWSTLILLGYWIIPAALVGWYAEYRSQGSSPSGDVPRPVF